MFQKVKLTAVVLLSSIILLSSCSEYQKLLKSSDYELKYTKAIEYYENQQYLRAITLFEELLILYKGTSKAEEIYYYYAYSYYGQSDFIFFNSTVMD